MTFQSTLPQGERHQCVFLDKCDMLYFNPRSHKGSDKRKCDVSELYAISIHAPTRGATSGFSRGANCDIYFNPRSHKGSDLFFLIAQCRAFNFNPRSHKGSDFHSVLCQLRAPYFNPRSHKGSDYVTAAVDIFWCLFQSTLPQGERR